MYNGSGRNQTLLTGLDSFKVTKNNKIKKNLQSPPSQNDPNLPPSAMLSEPRQQV